MQFQGLFVLLLTFDRFKLTKFYRFIDEQDPSRDRSLSPNYLMFGMSEGRRGGLTLHPGSKSQQQQQQVSHGDSNGANPADNNPAQQARTASPNSSSTSTATSGPSITQTPLVISTTSPTGSSATPANGRPSSSEKLREFAQASSQWI